MLKIRLMKPGKSIKRRYHFKVVVTESKRARDSRFTDQIGYYDPARKLLKIDIENYDSWVKKGAQPTEKVAALYRRFKREMNKNNNKEKEEGKE